MSSGTKYDPNAGRNNIAAIGPRVMGRIARLGLSPRQQELNRLYAHYRCVQYDSCKLDWDGLENVDPVEREAIATAGFIPAGFYDAGQTMPLKFRRPSAPYNLVKAIVDRFSGLLFSERHHPAFRAEGAPDTEDYASSLAQAARLWPEMIKARAMGGAMGTVAMGFKYVDGHPRVEVHDPRWLFPVFRDRDRLKLLSIEKRFMYPREERDPETGAWIPVWYWSRRIIDDERDVRFGDEPVMNGDEPTWEVEEEVAHGLGYCPVVWVQNLPVQDDVDGDPDCHGVIESIEMMDRLQAQAMRGTIKNCDPTMVITTNAPLGEVQKGSDNAVKLPEGGDAKYMELAGTSIKTAMDLCQALRTQILEVSQCVLEHPDVANQTATEVERRYEAMFSKADVLREQYGERCVKPLLTMMVDAARRLDSPTAQPDGTLLRRKVFLPPKIVDGKPVPVILPQKTDAPLELKWPPYLAPSTQEALQATQAASLARTAGLIDIAHAVGFVAPHYNVEDVPALVRILTDESDKKDADLAAQMTMGMPPVPGGGEDDDEGAQKAKPLKGMEQGFALPGGAPRPPLPKIGGAP